ncbi:hypothetical protein bthur0011_29960 [Bacillus thuringiensis serovar huazhongensis BGSC 4BD1]|uniref:hypothetical protein n=1 Tax=Bacillus cereus group sp. MYBK216-1 TaxID=3450663 RepID=UPI0001A210C6|nr:hypothetical protein bthur0011_29960 [Bacillus thuringiensis serovar huazhongensis BGSC 4BD1]
MYIKLTNSYKLVSFNGVVVILLLQNLQIYAILKNELKALDSLLEATSAFLRRNLTDHYNFIM